MMVFTVLMVFHQIPAIVQFLLQLRPRFAVFVQCTALDQVLELAGVMFKHESLVDEILVAAGSRGFFQRRILFSVDSPHLAS